MINDAETEGLLKPNTNSMIFEGTVGSTGISIATVVGVLGFMIESQSHCVVLDAGFRHPRLQRGECPDCGMRNPVG